MPTSALHRPHGSFWIIGAIALVWNMLGSINFFVQRDPEVLAAYRASERMIVEGRPAWATAAFALAVFGGVAGSCLLLLRRSAALPVFVASLLGVAGTMAHAVGIGIAFGPGEVLGIIVMPFAVAALLVWYARYAERKGWIG